MDLVPYKIIPGDNGDAWVESRGKKYAPSQISAFILQKMKETAEAYLGEPVTQAVITVPAYFNGQSAPGDQGRRPHRLGSKSCASSTSRPPRRSLTAWRRRAPARSRSTTSAAALRHLGAGNRRTGCSRSNRPMATPSFGGEDFDKKIIDYLADEFKKEQGIDLRSDKLALQRLKEAAEKAKIELSSSVQTTLTCRSSPPTRTGRSTSTSS